MPGQIVEGQVTKKAKNFVFVSLQNHTGRIHKAQFDLLNNVSAFDAIEPKQFIKAKVLSPGKPSIELSALTAHMNLPDGKLEETLYLRDNSKNINSGHEGIYQGVVKSIVQSSVTPLYIELSGSQLGSVSAFGQISQDPSFLNTLEQ